MLLELFAYLAAISAAISLVLAAFVFLAERLVSISRIFFTEQISILYMDASLRNGVHLVAANTGSSDAFLHQLVVYFPDKDSPQIFLNPSLPRILKPGETVEVRDAVRSSSARADVVAVSTILFGVQGPPLSISAAEAAELIENDDCFDVRVVQSPNELDMMDDFFLGIGYTPIGLDVDLSFRYYSGDRAMWRDVSLSTSAVLVRGSSSECYQRSLELARQLSEE